MNKIHPSLNANKVNETKLDNESIFTNVEQLRLKPLNTSFCDQNL